mgnify:CR=1 FL=1|jgi:SAM-dependent methyltransferase
MRYERYWNDEALERHKPYWVEDPADRRLLDYLQTGTNLLRSFEAGLAYADEHFAAVRGAVLDLGAGVCWTSAVVSRWPRVQKVHALDYSEHRLLKIAPLVFEQLGAATEKIERHRRPMSPLSSSDESTDLAIFCQALYMNRDPEKILQEVHRVLRPGGVAMITCESIVPSRSSAGRWVHQALRLWRYPVGTWREVLADRAPDASGRYQYVDRDYAAFITNAGLRLVRQHLDWPVFKHSPVGAVNYFGVKDRGRRGSG